MFFWGKKLKIKRFVNRKAPLTAVAGGADALFKRPGLKGRPVQWIEYDDR